MTRNLYQDPHSKYGTAPEAVTVKYAKLTNFTVRGKDIWQLLAIAHHLDFTEIGLSVLSNVREDPAHQDYEGGGLSAPVYQTQEGDRSLVPLL